MKVMTLHVDTGGLVKNRTKHALRWKHEEERN